MNQVTADRYFEVHDLLKHLKSTLPVLDDKFNYEEYETSPLEIEQIRKDYQNRIEVYQRRISLMLQLHKYSDILNVSLLEYPDSWINVGLKDAIRKN